VRFIALWPPTILGIAHICPKSGSTAWDSSSGTDNNIIWGNNMIWGNNSDMDSNSADSSNGADNKRRRLRLLRLPAADNGPRRVASCRLDSPILPAQGHPSMSFGDLYWTLRFILP